MRTLHYIIAIVGSAVILGCGSNGRGANAPTAEPPDYNWADYKGTYAPGAPATKDQAEAPPEKTVAKPSDAKDERSDAKALYAGGDDAKPVEDEAAPVPPKKKKKRKKGGVASGGKPTSPSAGTPKKSPRKRAKR